MASHVKARANNAFNMECAADVATASLKYSETCVMPPPGYLDILVAWTGRIRKNVLLFITSSIASLHIGIAVAMLMFAHRGPEFTLAAALLVTSGGFFFCYGLLVWCICPAATGRSSVPKEMAVVVSWIQEGAEGFFKVQYGTILSLAVLTSGALGLGFWCRNKSSYPAGLEFLYGLPMVLITVGSFLLGAFCSALSGYVGLWVSVRVNGEVASAARSDYDLALRLCFRGGAVCAITNLCLAVGGVSMFVSCLRWYFPSLNGEQCAILLSGFSFGASMVAMFAQLGGGIFTKAADIGADLVGKIEYDIPEDDPRNPAVIADLVGDNVGDCAGQCADLYESICAEIISAMIIGGSLATKRALPTEESWRLVLFPLLVHSVDIVVSSIGCLLVKAKPGKADAANCNPLKTMVKAYGVTCSLATVGLGIVCRYCLSIESSPSAWLYYYIACLVGLCVAAGFVIITQYYTDYEYSKVKSIAHASSSGAATNIITGMSVGMESTGPPVLMISAALLISYHLGSLTMLTPGSRLDGLLGCACATMGMLSSAGFILTMSSFGPIADNAGGIVEITHQPESVRSITDRLDSVGNVTKANTKGFSVGSAGLACFLLFSAFIDEVEVYSKLEVPYVDLLSPEVVVGGLLGGALVFVFAGKAMDAVSGTAQECVAEVRRQFTERPRILTGEEKPDYQTCVALSSRSALRHMVLPGILAISAPVLTGLLFRHIGQLRGDPLLGVNVLIGFQVFATVVGILMALFLNNAGGAWDNAKKYIETGPLGGKNSDAHKASIVGDTVGDPCKDTAGPSVHVLIKLICTVSIVLTPIFIGSSDTS
eukprot:GHVH01011164.1.p1 GENE.GHVH01011164.1~~GHVH01011164.1.p1  ORF type:complete len:826 (+),score=49.64 GHVH01011164.1:212-2689(+)